MEVATAVIGALVVALLVVIIMLVKCRGAAGAKSAFGAPPAARGARIRATT